MLLGERDEAMRKRDDHLIVTYVPKVFVESLDSAFENVCELDLVFHFDEVSCVAFSNAALHTAHTRVLIPKAHHILAEIIQGGLVLETNGTEIDRAGECSSRCIPAYPTEQRIRSAAHVP